MKKKSPLYKCQLCKRKDLWSIIWYKGIDMCDECYFKFKNGKNKKIKECEHCHEPLSEHDDGEYPMPKDVYDKE